jgi:hypothetical protein
MNPTPALKMRLFLTNRIGLDGGQVQQEQSIDWIHIGITICSMLATFF